MRTTNSERAFVNRLKTDPIHHITEIQGVSLEDYQRGVVDAINQNARVVITSCHGVGKTFTMARVVLWFTSTHSRCKVITTATTFKQVRMLLWSEIRAGYAQSRVGLGGAMLTTEWKLSEDWFAVGIASRREAGTETHGSGMQGFHAPYILIVMDEAQGIPPDIWKQVEGMTTSANVKVVAIGNPLAKGSPFYEATKSRFWKHVSLTCFDSPNLLANDISDIESLREEIELCRSLPDDKLLKRLDEYKITHPYLITTRWVVEMGMSLGIDHPLFKSKALGMFPEDTENALIPLSIVQEAQLREAKAEGRSHFGIDVARFGSDKTVITEIRGRVILPPIKLVKKSNTEVVGFFLNLLEDCPNPASVSIDATGVGSGVVDVMKERLERKNIRVNEIHFGQSCPSDQEKKRFANLKALMFKSMREGLSTDLCLSDDPAYQEQLPDIRYEIDSQGRIKIESKDDYKARTGRQSPDESDSLALAIYDKLIYDKRGDVSFDLGGLSLTKSSTWRV